MLKTTRNTEFKIWPGKGKIRVSGDSRVGRARSKIDESEKDNVEVDGDEVEFDEVGKKVQKSSKSKKTVRSLNFLTPGAKLAFTKLRQAFFKTLILYHFDPEYHIRIETDVSGYAIGGVLSQLTSDDLCQWHLVAFFSCKMILAETRYETHNGKLLAIVKTFKTWSHYLKGS